jgi:Predicted membrane protein
VFGDTNNMNFNRHTVLGVIGVIALGLLAMSGSGLALGQGSMSSVLDDGDDDDTIAAENVSLSEQEAIDIATAETNGTVEELELESEDGTPVYEVELITADGTETEVAVHANDGTVLETESDDEADEMDDDESDEMDDDDERSSR